VLGETQGWPVSQTQKHPLTLGRRVGVAKKCKIFVAAASVVQT
jgi:hypothetical protein